MKDSGNQGIDDLLRFARETLRASGEELLSYFGKGITRIKFDESLVTEAELHVREFFQNQLYRRFPDHRLYGNSQENRAYTHDDERFVWVFDGLDGVANFQAGIPIWGMSVALLENFWPILGIYYLPITGDLFWATADGAAYWGKRAITVSIQEEIDDESLLLTYSRFHNHFRASFPGKIRDFGCTGAHICYVAMGRAEAALIANESFKDLAALRVIIEAAGGKIFSLDGTEIRLNEYLDGRKIEQPLLVAPPGTFRQVRDSLNRSA